MEQDEENEEKYITENKDSYDDFIMDNEEKEKEENIKSNINQDSDNINKNNENENENENEYQDEFEKPFIEDEEDKKEIDEDELYDI